MLQAADIAYVGMDAGGFVTDLNAAAEAAFVWTHAEAVGRPLGELMIPAGLRRAHVNGLARFLATGGGPLLGRRLTLDALHRDGHEFPVELTIGATRDGATHRFHALLHDISERRRAERYLQTQHALTAVITEAETVDAAVPGVLHALGEGMGWDAGACWVPDAAGELRCAAIWRAEDVRVERFARACREHPFAPAADPPMPARDDRTAALASAIDGRSPARWAAAADAGLRAAITLPLLDHAEFRGALEFFTRAPHRDEPELLDMMAAFAAQIARFMAILSERQAILAKLEWLALTDDLTGLPNRRAWNDGLLRDFARARRHGKPLCVAMLDIDRFKAFNDRCGHQAGDDALARTARLWRSSLREGDLIARYGGEEFALAFCGHAVETAFDVVERLRSTMPYGLTCSAGLASWTAGEAPFELVGRADRALYEAKRAGRDCTIVAR